MCANLSASVHRDTSCRAKMSWFDDCRRALFAVLSSLCVSKLATWWLTPVYACMSACMYVLYVCIYVSIDFLKINIIYVFMYVLYVYICIHWFLMYVSFVCVYIYIHLFIINQHKHAVMYVLYVCIYASMDFLNRFLLCQHVQRSMTQITCVTHTHSLHAWGHYGVALVSRID